MIVLFCSATGISALSCRSKHYRAGCIARSCAGK